MIAIAQVAKALLGPPNQQLSGKTNWRYGTHGSLSVDLTENVWRDHDTNKEGGILDLINRERGGDHDEALRWLNHRCNTAFRLKPSAMLSCVMGAALPARRSASR